MRGVFGLDVLAYPRGGDRPGSSPPCRIRSPSRPCSPPRPRLLRASGHPVRCV